MKNTILICAVVVLVLIGLYFFLAQKSTSIDGAEQRNGAQNQEELGEPAVTILRTVEGYEPKGVTIKKGDIVLWTNETDEFHWPASDLHPTHGIYPEFDPLTPIAAGDSWKFKFDKVGVWKFHDHIRANKTGTVTVVE